jgi:hypothetical protein
MDRHWKWGAIGYVLGNLALLAALVFVFDVGDREPVIVRNQFPVDFLTAKYNCVEWSDEPGIIYCERIEPASDGWGWRWGH